MERNNQINSNSSFDSKKSRMLSRLYNVSAKFAEDHNSSHRGAVADVAASLLDMELGRIGNKDKKRGVDNTNMDFDDTFSTDSSISENSRSNHFSDIFMEKLIKHAIPMDSSEREILEKRLYDKERVNKPKLSLKILASNFKKLSTKISIVFLVQYGIVHAITWKKPSKTLSILVLYTALCIRPHLILIYPLLFFFMGIIIPAFLKKHPMRTPELIKVKKRGQSLLDFFNDSEDVSIVDDLISDNISDSDTDSLRPTSSQISDTSLYTPGLQSSISADLSNDPKKEHKKEHYAKSQIVLLMNMRDLQNLTTDLLRGMDEFQKMLVDTASFKNEKLTTFISYGIILSILGVLCFGCFIPWRMIFISSGWLLLLLCHPNFKKYIEDMKKSKKVNAFIYEEKIRTKPDQNILKHEKKEKLNEKFFDRNDIVISDSKNNRTVEVYELQVKNLVSNEWEFYLYSNTLFDYSNSIRVSGRKPQGVSKLNNVLPPSNWKFDYSSQYDWCIDKEPSLLLQNRSLNRNNTMEILENEEDGWIYDSYNESKNWDIEYTFRRRRLFRNCFQY